MSIQSIPPSCSFQNSQLTAYIEPTCSQVEEPVLLSPCDRANSYCINTGYGFKHLAGSKDFVSIPDGITRKKAEEVVRNAMNQWSAEEGYTLAGYLFTGTKRIHLHKDSGHHLIYHLYSTFDSLKGVVEIQIREKRVDFYVSLSGDYYSEKRYHPSYERELYGLYRCVKSKVENQIPLSKT